MRGLGGLNKKEDTTFSGFHELIKLPDIPFPFYSLRCVRGGSLMSSSRCPGLDTLSASCESGRTQWIELLTIFSVNWRDGGEWTGQRKSGRWHLATITALWPRLVKCCVGLMNNKPSAESLWLAGDVLHSHHPSQAGDHWREFIYLLKFGAERHENTTVHLNAMTGFRPSIK